MTHSTQNHYGVAIHGGAGTILPENMSREEEQAIRKSLLDIIKQANDDLSSGKSALDVVEKAVKALEDNPFFNAGKGSVYTQDGKHELDASIMDGATLSVGAVAGIRYSPNPVTLARCIMEKSDHVFLAGTGAERFAIEQNLPQVSNDWFDTEKRHRQLLRAQKAGGFALEDDGIEKKFGTVGAVALDRNGNLAAATSTGGITNKAFGRVGDSPVIGAGNYANNDTCAVSCTGHGEIFIRKMAAYDVHARIAYQGVSLPQAADIVVTQELPKLSGSGGLIAIDKYGVIAMPFNSTSMYRASASEHQAPIVAIYRDE